MKKIIMAVGVLMLLCVSAWAGQKYNAFTGRWETVPDGWTPQYNAFSGGWSYQPQGCRQVYNPFTGRWEWESGHN